MERTPALDCAVSTALDAVKEEGFAQSGEVFLEGGLAQGGESVCVAHEASSLSALLQSWDTFDAIVCTSAALAESLNDMRLEASVSGALGALAVDAASWVGGLWELDGDRRRPVSARQRSLLCRQALALCAFDLRLLAQTPHLCDALAAFVRDGCGFAAFDALMRRESIPSEGISEVEAEFATLASCYFELLEQAGLVEYGQMLTGLARNAEAFFPRPLRLALCGNGDEDVRLERALRAGGNVTLTCFSYASNGPLEKRDAGAPRFVFPSGRYAEGKLMLEALLEALRLPAPTAGSACAEGVADSEATVLAKETPRSGVSSQSFKTESRATAVLTAKRPYRWFRLLAAPLAQRGITCTVQDRLLFAETDLGRAMLLLERVLASGPLPWDKDALSDLLHSPLMGLSKRNVWAWNRRLREDRLLPKEPVLDELRNGNPAYGDEKGNAFFGLLEELLVRPSAKAFDALQSFLRARELREEAWVIDSCGEEGAWWEDTDRRKGAFAGSFAQSSAVLRTARATFDEANALGCFSVDDFLRMLEGASVPINLANSEQRADCPVQVRIMTQEQAALLPPHSCEALAICDAHTEAYPLRDADDAVSLFLRKLDARFSEPALSRARRTWAALLRVPQGPLFIERCLLDAEANPSYPCAMVEELTDAYRDPAEKEDARDLDNIFRLPFVLQNGLLAAGEYDGPQRQFGETDLLQTVLPGVTFAQAAPVDSGISHVGAFDDKEDAPEGGACAYGEGRSFLRDMVAFPKESQHPLREGCVPVLSPTQMETYLECPYKWFVERRLAATGLDEEFGAVNVGTFLHACFQRFYERFKRETGAAKVTKDLLIEAKAIMAEVFSQVKNLQAQLAPGHRFAPIPGSSEEYEVASLEEQLMQWLEFEAGFLPDFAPAAFEFSLSEALPLYAGARWRGSVDRIDVRQGDGVERFAVVDYKGSLSNTRFMALDKQGRYAQDGKVQALIYAGALEQMFAENALRCADAASGSGGCAEDDRLSRLSDAKPVAALYVSYKRGNALAGAYDISELGMPGVSESRARSMGLAGLRETGKDDAVCEEDEATLLQTPPTFEGLRAFSQRRIERAVSDMRAGRVRPHPAYPEVCKYCAVLTCPERRSEYAAY